VGSAKPDGAIFAAALELAGTGDAWHVGDTVQADVEGAIAAGLTPVFIARGRPLPALPGDVAVIESLAELIPLALRR
jgi:putative hydrolase of the HAD superfamily